MRRARVTPSPEFRRDLNEIAERLEDEAGIPVARHWTRRLRQAASSLAEFPERSATDPDLGGRRRLVVAPYLIVYSVEQDRVRLLRILDGRRDLPSLMQQNDADEGSP